VKLSDGLGSDGMYGVHHGLEKLGSRNLHFTEAENEATENALLNSIKCVSGADDWMPI
jgi:hypothetical protein